MFIFSPLYGAAQRVPQLGCPVHVEINPRRQEIFWRFPGQREPLMVVLACEWGEVSGSNLLPSLAFQSVQTGPGGVDREGGTHFSFVAEAACKGRATALRSA